MNLKKFLGWSFLIVIAAFSSFWAFWGITETFYEGWYSTSILQNIWLTISRYLLPVWLILFPGVLSLYYQRTSSLIFLVMGIVIAIYFSQLFFFVPLLVISFLCWIGILPMRKISNVVMVAPALLTLAIAGTPQVYRVATRFNGTSNIQFTTEVDGNKVIWAPPGPGWPEQPVNWVEAVRICSHLSEGGDTLVDSVHGVWRLPTVEEIVVSTHHHGKLIGGKWNPENHRAEFETTPDKEPPMWNPYSPIIYWWTSDELKGEQAYMISYNGIVFSTSKNHKAGYYGFRAVKVLCNTQD